MSVETSTASTIAETVAAALPSYIPASYQGHVDTVVASLTEREYDIADALVEAAQAQGISTDRVLSALAEVGLSVRPEPEPEPEPEAVAEGGETDARISRLESAVASLQRIAESAQRRFGF